MATMKAVSTRALGTMGGADEVSGREMQAKVVGVHALAEKSSKNGAELEEDDGKPAVAVVSESLTVIENAAVLHAEMFDAYPELEAKRVSRLEREAKELANRSLVYGKIPFDTVRDIFQVMRAQFGVLLDRGGNFYDIGSGCGKVVLAAALLHDFNKCCGIEVLDGLHSMALKALDHWRYKILDDLPVVKADMDVGFAKGDATQLTDVWRDATMLFCNATCFSDSLLEAIASAADQVADGAYFVSVTKPLPSKRWKTVLEQKFPMSWGAATVIIQKKLF